MWDPGPIRLNVAGVRRHWSRWAYPLSKHDNGTLPGMHELDLALSKWTARRRRSHRAADSPSIKRRKRNERRWPLELRTTSLAGGWPSLNPHAAPGAFGGSSPLALPPRACRGAQRAQAVLQRIQLHCPASGRRGPRARAGVRRRSVPDALPESGNVSSVHMARRVRLLLPQECEPAAANLLRQPPLRADMRTESRDRPRIMGARSVGVGVRDGNPEPRSGRLTAADQSWDEHVLATERRALPIHAEGLDQRPVCWRRTGARRR